MGGVIRPKAFGNAPVVSMVTPIAVASRHGVAIAIGSTACTAVRLSTWAGATIVVVVVTATVIATTWKNTESEFRSPEHDLIQ